MITTAQFTISVVSDGVGIVETIVEYCISSSGTVVPGSPLTDENDNVIYDVNGLPLTDGQWLSNMPQASEGDYIWTRSKTIYSNGTFALAYMVSHQGEQGTQGVSVVDTITEYRLSNSSSSLTGSGTGYSWSETKPAIDSTAQVQQYIWRRPVTILSNGNMVIGDARCDLAISNVSFEVDRNAQAITAKVSKTDIETILGGDYDLDDVSSITQSITDRFSTNETSLQGITTEVGNIESTIGTGPNDTTTTTLWYTVSHNEQTADAFRQTVTQNYAQLTDVDNKIANIKVGGNNLYVIADEIPGYVTGTGVISAQDPTNKEVTSAYIPVQEGEDYIIQSWATPNTTGQSWLAYQFYANTTGTTVGSRKAKYGNTAGSGVTITAEGQEHLSYSVKVPQNANYLRVSYRKFNDGYAMVEKATVPSEYSINTRDVEEMVNNIDIGVRNLLKETDIGTTPKTSKGITVDYEGDGWFHIYGTVTGTSDGLVCLYGSTSRTSNLISEPGEYTFSVYGDTNTNTDIKYQIATHSNAATNDTIAQGITLEANQQEMTFTLAEGYHVSRVAFYMNGLATGDEVDLHVRMKLEKGNKSTDWTPAPEDTIAQISNTRTIAEQTADRFGWIVQDGSTQSSVQYTANALTAMANQIDLTGKVTFNSMDSTLQNRVTTAESNASTAASDAASAVSTANTANTNASNAVSAVNNSIKSTTMHYLATSASSGVTRSTSGWTTTIQSIDATKRYLWTYQTITKVNNTTTDTDPVISGVWGNTGGQGNPGVSVTKVEQLYRTSSSTTAPAAPTSIVNSTSTTYDTWTLAMPTYNASYPYYYTCTQTTYSSGNPTWTTPARCKAIEDANVTANSANTTANTANTNASNAVTTANTANTNASNAVTTANTANTTANNAATSAATANEKANPGLGMKVNYSTFSSAEPGEVYLHGYTDNVAADVDGYVYWNGVKRTVPKKMINPNAIVPYQTTCYIVLRLSSSTATTGTLYMVWHNSGWKYAVTPTPSAVGGTWSWTEATDIVLGQFVEPASEGQIVDAYLYNPPRNASHILTTGNNPYQYAKNSVDWVNTNGSAVVTAKNIVDSWKGEAENNVTTINGGLIQTHTILAKNLATNAIMSENYSSGTQNQDTPSSTDNPAFFSQYGTFMDLANGNIYSPNFTVINSDPFPDDSNVVTPGTFMNGTIHANAGYFGSSSQHWNIETVYDYNNVAHAALVGVGSPYIQTGNWQISDNQISTKKYTSTAEATGRTTYYKDASSNTFYDVGVKIPTNFTAPSDQDGKDVTFAKSFFYGRKYTGDNIPAFDDDWSYLFMVDNAGNLYEKGQLLSERYAAIGDVEGAYVSTTGGTVNGNLTVTGTLTATASAAVKLSTARNLNVNLATTSNDGKVAFDGSANVTLGITGTLGVAHGGTGATTFASGQVLIGNNAGAITTREIKNNTSQGPLGWTSSTVDNTLITTNTLAYWDGRYQATNNASNIQYVRQGKLGTVVTHDVEEFITSSGGTVNGALTVTDLAAGNLVVNGGATFTNGLTGDLTGNVVGIATYATKVKDSGNNTDTTFAYSKSGLAANWTTSPWFAAWNGYELRAISPANLRTTIGAMPATKTFTQNDIVPVLSKTYTDVIATANDQDNGALYFIKVLPTTYAGSWYIKYHVSATIAGVSAANGSGYEESTVEIYGMRDTYSAYRIWNAISNISYRPYYYHCFYRAKEAGITGGYGHALGVHLRYSYNPVTAANSRTINVEILETSGCTVTLLDEPVKYANWTGTGTTNYNTYTNFDAATQGVTITGDRNDVNYYNRNYYGCRTTYTALYRYQLCLTRKDRSLLPINTVNNSVATNKELTTESFDPFGDILYWASTATYSAGANVGDGWYSQYLADIRFSFNIGGNDVDSTLIGRKPLYLVAVPQTDGSAKLHTSPLAQDLPNTEDGLIYIYLGQVYPDTKPYRLYMSLQHSIYWYKDGAVRPYSTYTANAEAAVKDGSGNVISSTYVKKAGDTIGGSLTFNQSDIGISRPGVSGTWKEGRDKALIKSTAASGNSSYDAFASIKTFNGSWDVGVYHIDTQRDRLIFAYIPDTMYNGTNTTPNRIKFNTDGSITASLDGNAATATTATQADHVANSLTIQLNGGSTEGTNKFTYNGSGAKSFNITKSSIGLGNVTNNAQVKGLSSGTTSGHLVTWGSDGYTVADSGITKGNIVKSVASDSDGKLVLTYADDTTSDPITVQFVASSASSVNIANSLNVGGTAVGSTSLPVYFTNQGKPAVITSLPKSYVGLGNVDNTADANKNVLSATKFTSAQSITLTGDTTGTASSQAGWSIATTTKYIHSLGRIDSADIQIKDNLTSKISCSLSSVSMTTSKPPAGDGYILTFGWDNNGWGSQLFIKHTTKPCAMIRGASSVNVDGNNGLSQWGDWYYLLDSHNFNTYAPKKDGTGASGDWGINITGNAATATSATSLTPTQLTNQNLNDIKTVLKTNYYFGAGSNNVINNPMNSSTTPDTNTGLQFGMYTYASAGGHVAQELSGYGPTHGKWIRWFSGTSWTSWEKFITSQNYTDYTVTKTGSGASGTWDISISGNATNDSAGNKIVDTYVKKSGDTITGTLILSRTTDLSGTANNKPALIVGGTDTQAHIEIDSNEIQAKATGTTTTTLYINNDGGAIYLGPNITANGTTVTATTFSGTATKANTLATSSGTSAGARPVWYSYLGDNTKAVYHTEFTYNPSGGVLKATTFDGNATSATKATQDGDGNTISSTYAKLSGATFTGAVTGTSFAASNYVSVNSGNSGTNGGLALYSTTPTNYGIAMRGTSSQGKHGYVQGDWATYFFMIGSTQANSINRGWIFKNNTSGTQVNVASISNAGNAAFNGSVTVGGNETNTSGCEMIFDSTTNSLNFVFK